MNILWHLKRDFNGTLQQATDDIDVFDTVSIGEDKTPKDNGSNDKIVVIKNEFGKKNEFC